MCGKYIAGFEQIKAILLTPYQTSNCLAKVYNLSFTELA